jgi:small-conductance mechanosensitive channel
MLSQPSDVFFWNAERTLANQTVPAAIASSRAMLPLVPAAPKAPNPAAADAEQQRLAQRAAARISHIENLQSQLAALDRQIAATSDPALRAPLAGRRAALQSELNFLVKLRDAVQKVGGLLTAPGDGSSATTLAGQIDSLQLSVADELAAVLPPPAADPAAAKGMGSGGLIARAGALLRLGKCLRGLDRLIEVTEQLQQQTALAQAPLSAAIRPIVQQGDAAGEKLESADAGQYEGTERLEDSLADKFDSLWSALLPLRQEAALLDQSRRNLQEWRDSVRAREIDLARSLGIRVLTIAIMLVIVLAVSAIGRRMILRYAHEERRSRQFLFISRIVTAILVLIVIGTGFVSDFGSLATFAGLLTAGIAVALQTIIASMAAYFFLLGRHGLKVGDRITAGGVTGEVADVGLVRFYLRELVASGPDLHPTGRVVVFPNSVIFQTNPLFKQLAGTAYTWHEASVTLAGGANAALVREKMLAAVNAAYAEYRPLLEAPRAKAEKVSGIKTDLPKPYAHLRAHDKDLELGIGYPVNFEHVSEIDQLVLKHVSDAIAADPAVDQGISGRPRIGVAVRS